MNLLPTEYPYHLSVRSINLFSFRIGHMFLHYILLYSSIFHKGFSKKIKDKINFQGNILTTLIEYILVD